jgi:hypothetical protein
MSGQQHAPAALYPPLKYVISEQNYFEKQLALEYFSCKVHICCDKWVPVKGMASPQVADGGTASNMQCSYEYIE